jgi:hypothetical protein
LCDRRLALFEIQAGENRQPNALIFNKLTDISGENILGKFAARHLKINVDPKSAPLYIQDCHP